MKRYLIVLLILSASLTIMARSPLTFEERVKAQEAIERVYYNHRIWPKENPQPKPPFEKMVPKEVIEAKVTDYLKKCSALDQFWQRPIIASQLQAEMDRVAKGTKDPATLNELFAALNNDPYLIAECLARPVLAERLINNWYANDERFHKEARDKAEEALKHLTPENFCSYPEGQYSKMTYRLEIEGREEMDEPEPEDNSVQIDEKEFAKMLAKIPDEGKISGMMERSDCFFIVHTVYKKDFEVEIESLSFAKQDVKKWLQKEKLCLILTGDQDRAENYGLLPANELACSIEWDNGILGGDQLQEPREHNTAVWTGVEMIIWGGRADQCVNSGSKYNPATDTWTATSTGMYNPSARIDHSAVWTGTEMIIWGGNVDAAGIYTNTGGRYNPSSDNWVTTSCGNDCPDARSCHTAVWTGTEMILWGGQMSALCLNTGGKYDPSSDTWTATSTGTNCPTGRYYHTALWTGTEMIVWGGFSVNSGVATGGRYNPQADIWTATSIGPSARFKHSAVWTGTEMIIWGSSTFSNTGGRYNPSSDSWATTSTQTGCPAGRYSHAAVWTGTEMVIWGGAIYGGIDVNTGGRYNPVTNKWVETSTGTNCPDIRNSPSAVWTGTEMIVWGGHHHNALGTGGRYSPATNTWVTTSGAIYNTSARINHTALWTGSEMIIWGGNDSYTTFNTGGKYDPATDSWMATSTQEVDVRSKHTAVWTGTGMIVWGGSDFGVCTRTGGIYNPSSDTYLWISLGTDCPTARYDHTAVWTGTEMIVWGGTGSTGKCNTGARYKPSTDSWSVTSVSAGSPVPESRTGHTAVWTGSEMIIWGGIGSTGKCNTGAIYNPSTDSWTATSTNTGCPSARIYHTAVWTGSDMIIWGGLEEDGNASTGGYYNLASDSWHATSTGIDCPSGRREHSAIWTGSEMIVWGGWTGSLNTSSRQDGGQYSPSDDSWVPTSTGDGCPVARYRHKGVWTGEKMIVWGGCGASGYLNSGGIYNLNSPPSGYFSDSLRAGGNCSGSEILLEWIAPSHWGDGGRGTRTYDILRDSTAVATGLTESTVSYTDTTGESGVYQIRANNGCELHTTTTGVAIAGNEAIPPSEMANNVSTDNDLCYYSGVNISWTAPSNWADLGNGTRTFDVLRDGVAIVTGLPESQLSYTDTTGANGVSYLYRVRANNGCSLSTTTSGVTIADMGTAVPSGFSNNAAASISGCSDNGVMINWAAPSNWEDNGSGTRTFDVLRDSAAIAACLFESQLSYTDTTGENGVLYLYQVRANSGCGLSATTVGTSAMDMPGASTLGEIVPFYWDAGTLSWPSAPAATGYRLYRGTWADMVNLTNSTDDGCLRYDGASTSFDCSADDASTVTERFYWYLVTAYDGACEGTAGEGTGFLRNLSSTGACE